MTPEASDATVFRYPASTRKFVVAISLACTGILAYVLLIRSVDLSEGLPTFLLLAAAAVFWCLGIFTYEIRTDDIAILERTLFSTTTLEWQEVEDFLSSSRLILLTGRGGLKRMRFYRGEPPFSLGRFEELRDEITRRVQPPLVERWKQISLVGGRVYPYPPLSLGQSIAYLIPLSLIGFFFVAAPVWEGHFQAEQLVFLAVAVFCVGVFFVRDYRRTRRRITLREDGIVEGNGKSTVLLWREIERLVIKETSFMGFGSVVVGGDGKKIKIPRRIRDCGELLFLVLSRSRPTIVESFEY